jgi:hypothetical protein
LHDGIALVVAIFHVAGGPAFISLIRTANEWIRRPIDEFRLGAWHRIGNASKKARSRGKERDGEHASHDLEHRESSCASVCGIADALYAVTMREKGV